MHNSWPKFSVAVSGEVWSSLCKDQTATANCRVKNVESFHPVPNPQLLAPCSCYCHTDILQRKTSCKAAKHQSCGLTTIRYPEQAQTAVAIRRSAMVRKVGHKWFITNNSKITCELNAHKHDAWIGHSRKCAQISSINDGVCIFPREFA